MSLLDSLLGKLGNAAKKAVTEGVTSAATKAVTNKTVTVTFDALPQNVEEMKRLSGAGLNDPYAVAAYTIAALDVFPKNRDACYEMLNFLKGPSPLTQRDEQFIRDRFMDGSDYIPRSYFAGTSVENDYTPTVPYKIDILELAHSRDQINEGYLKLFIRSSGADNERYMVLRNKPSTNQWFLWQFEGVLVGIRQPKSKNAWA